MTPGALLDGALDFAGRGVRVLSLKPRAKVPDGALVPHGLKEASTDPEVIRAWWTTEPEANIGLRTGETFDVLDVDGDEGMAALNSHLPSLDDSETVDGPTVRTGGGWQVYVKPTGLGNRARFLPGCDWRGRGGYVVAPPSVHPSGRLYEWLVWDMTEPIREAPAWLLALLRQREAPGPALAARRRQTAYGRRALESECGRVALAPEGTRNDQLNRSAHALGQLAAGGHLMPSEAGEALVIAAIRAGLCEAEAVATIRSGLRAGMRQPRRTA